MCEQAVSKTGTGKISTGIKNGTNEKVSENGTLMLNCPKLRPPTPNL